MGVPASPEIGRCNDSVFRTMVHPVGTSLFVEMLPDCCIHKCSAFKYSRVPFLNIGQGGACWLCCLRGWVHASRTESELLSQGRSGCAPARSAGSLKSVLMLLACNRRTTLFISLRSEWVRLSSCEIHWSALADDFRTFL